MALLQCYGRPLLVKMMEKGCGEDKMRRGMQEGLWEKICGNGDEEGSG